MHDPILIRIEMAKRELNIAELARMSGVSRPTIHQVLKGGNTSLKTLAKLATALGVETASFFKSVV